MPSSLGRDTLRALLQGTKSPTRMDGLLAPQGGGALPLSVVMGPQRARTTISFQPRDVLSSGASQRPKLTVFAHEPGSRVHKDLFPVYQMPNGQMAFMYYNAGRVQVCILSARWPFTSSCAMHVRSGAKVWSASFRRCTRLKGRQALVLLVFCVSSASISDVLNQTSQRQ